MSADDGDTSGAVGSRIAAILEAHRVEDRTPGPSGAHRFDLLALRSGDVASCEPPAAAIENPERVVLAVDRLASDGAEYARIDRFVERSGIQRVIPFGDCGYVTAEILERGFLKPGDLVVGGGRSGSAVGGLGVLEVAVRDPVACLTSGFVTCDSPRIARVELHAGEALARNAWPDRWVSASDVGLLLASCLEELGLHGAAIELSGPAFVALSLGDRQVVCGILGAWLESPVVGEVDERTIAWLRARTTFAPDPRSIAMTRTAIDHSVSIEFAEPCFATERSRPTAVCDVESRPIGGVFVGGALGARLEDLRALAHMLREHPIAPGVRCIVAAATPRTMLHAAQEGLVSMLLRAGVRIEAPGAAITPLLTSLLGPGERGLTTCFDEPLPSGWSLTSTTVCAASAILGRIAHPDEVLRRRKESV